MSSRKTVLELINKNSLTLYCLLKSRKIKTKDIYEAVLRKDKEFVLKQLLPITDRKLKSLQKQYTKRDILNEILYLTDNRYHHLKEIKNIVNIDATIELTITDKIYDTKLNIHYTDLIIDLLIEDFYDYKSLQLLSKLRKKVIDMDSKANKKIISNIDKFYIHKITV